jgi:hypothetical protein
MRGTHHGFNIGDQLEYRPDFLEEGSYHKPGDYGTVISVDGDYGDLVTLEMSNGDISQFMWYDLESYVDYSKLNEREKLKYNYRRWVIDYTAITEKAHVTMDEVQDKYSSLAIRFAISELQKLSESCADGKTLDQIRRRAEELEDLLE